CVGVPRAVCEIRSARNGRRLHSTGGTMCRIARFTAFFLLSIATADAQEATRRFAALSMIGDSLTVVHQAANVGSRLSQQRPEAVSFDPRFFDRAALQAIQASIRAVDARAPIALFAASAAALARDPRDLFEGGK